MNRIAFLTPPRLRSSMVSGERSSDESSPMLHDLHYTSIASNSGIETQDLPPPTSSAWLSIAPHEIPPIVCFLSHTFAHVYMHQAHLHATHAQAAPAAGHRSPSALLPPPHGTHGAPTWTAGPRCPSQGPKSRRPSGGKRRVRVAVHVGSARPCKL